MTFANLSFFAFTVISISLLSYQMQVVATNNFSEAGVFLLENGDMQLLAVPGRDIIVGNVSINETVRALERLFEDNAQLEAEMSNLAAQKSAIDAQYNTTRADLSRMSAEFSTLKSQVSSLLASESVGQSICTLDPSPQVLAQSFETYATFKSSNGTLFLVAEQDNQTILHVYDGDIHGFVPHQVLWSALNTVKVTAFNVGAMQYVALPFMYDGATYNYRCELFMFNESSMLLVSVQNISTFGVFGASALTAIDGVTYLALSNYRSQAGSSINPSYIMRYNNATGLFEHFQNVTTNGASVPELFTVYSDVYLAIPNYANNTGVISKLDAVSGIFDFVQSISVSGGIHMKPWTRHSQHYLSVANYAGGYVDVFAFNSSLGAFVNVSGASRLYSLKPNGIDVIETGGDTYMAVGPWGTDARIYKWNDTMSAFVQTQQVSITSDWYFPQFFMLAADTFLALADRIYKLCDGQFVLA
jgi:hypothetical protein